MAAPLTASMPQFTQLGYNTSIVLEGLDPTTGDPVTGIEVTVAEIWADVTLGSDSIAPAPVVVGPYMLQLGPQA